MIPARIPGVWDPNAINVLQPRWARMRSRLMWGLIWCPLLFVLLAAAVAVAAAALEPRWWLLVAPIGSALPAVFMSRTARSALFEPSKWVFAAVLGGMCQFLLGGIVTLAAGAALAPAIAVGTFVLQWTLIVSAGVLCRSAMRALMLPLCPELGFTALSIPFRARVSARGLTAASASVAADRVRWYASSNKVMGARSTGTESVTFDRIAGARAVDLAPDAPAYPFVRLWTGEVVSSLPGPAVALTVDSGEIVLPMNEPWMFVELLNRRIWGWRHGMAR